MTAPEIRTTRLHSRSRAAVASRHRERRHPGEHGQAVLVATIVLAVIMGIIAATLFQTANDNITVIGHAVQGEQALRAARSGIDIAYQQVQAQTNVTTVPCGTATRPLPPTAKAAPTLPATTKTNTSPRVRGTLSGHLPSHYSVKLTYYSTPTPVITLTDPTKSTPPLSCATMHAHSLTTIKAGVHVDPKAVMLTSTGIDATQTRHVISLAHVAVATVKGTRFTDAVYASDLTLSGDGSITVDTKPIYIDTTAVCKGSGKKLQITGDVIVNGNLTVHCTIIGSVTTIASSATTGSISVTASGLITGPPGDTVHAGRNIKWSKGKADITLPMYAKGTITPATTTPPTFQHATFQSPTPQKFPPLPWTSSLWGQAGYHVYATTGPTGTGTACTKLAKILTTTLPTATQPWAIHTRSCQLTKGLALNQSLAFFTTASIHVGPPQFTAAPGHTPNAPIYLYIVQPPPATPPATPTTFPIMVFSGGAGAVLPIHVFLYTWGSVTMKGGATFAQVQVYATHTYTPSGNPSLTTPIPTPIHLATGYGTPDGPVTVGIVFVRERSP